MSYEKKLATTKHLKGYKTKDFITKHLPTSLFLRECSVTTHSYPDN